jgi:hypothetical protein
MVAATSTHACALSQQRMRLLCMCIQQIGNLYSLSLLELTSRLTCPPPYSAGNGVAMPSKGTSLHTRPAPAPPGTLELAAAAANAAAAGPPCLPNDSRMRGCRGARPCNLQTVYHASVQVLVNALMQFAGKPIRQITLQQAMGTTDQNGRAQTASANPLWHG